MLHEIGLAALTLIARRFENSANKKKHASEAWCFFLFALFIRDPERISCADPQKLRFENSANKKKHASEAWCFFFICTIYS